MLNEAKKELNWKKLGVLPEKYEDQDDDSALWIGTSGAYTPCHYDTYGFNIHVQLKGTKRWILFPPEDDLMPTRIPYEKSISKSSSLTDPTNRRYLDQIPLEGFVFAAEEIDKKPCRAYNRSI
uniref:JmjC domain-containing protein n=1 Tax=Acrobeloides nanus TaxID=290746 RepID=A0A914DSA5_9BILA